MGRTEYRCACGQALSRPLPRKCPGCGGVLAGVRPRRFRSLVSFLLAAGAFAALLAYLFWWLRFVG